MTVYGVIQFHEFADQAPALIVGSFEAQLRRVAIQLIEESNAIARDHPLTGDLTPLDDFQTRYPMDAVDLFDDESMRLWLEAWHLEFPDDVRLTIVPSGELLDVRASRRMWMMLRLRLRGVLS